MICPHCGGDVDQAPRLPPLDPAFDDDRFTIVLPNSERRRATPMEWDVLLILRERAGRYVPTDFLVRAAAPSPIDGGSEGSLKVRVSSLRKKLSGTPYGISTAYTKGYALLPISDIRQEGRYGAR